MGYRELSELSFLDYVVGITIGSIGAELATNVDKSWWRGLVAMVVFSSLEIILALISRKSIKIRGFINGNPIVIMIRGEIDRKALKKAQIDINVLLTQAREQGYFDLSDIDYAIMETNGKISFLPTPQKRQLSPQDFNFNTTRTGLCINLIIDGRVIEDNLKYAGITKKELEKILRQKRLHAEDVLLLTYDEQGKTQVFKNSLSK